MSRFVRVLLFLLLTVSLPQMASLAQTTDYNKVVAQARADLTAGHNEQALTGSQKGIGIDPSRWEAYLVAGSALENQKQFDAAIANYTKALERAPEPKKAGVRNLLEQCRRERLSATPSPAASAPAATTQGPTFKETLDWLISKNSQEGYSYSETTSMYASDGYQSGPDTGNVTKHVDFAPDAGGAQCAAVLTYGVPQAGEFPINFSASTPNSIEVKPVDLHKLSGEGTEVRQNGANSALGATSTFVTKVTTDHDIVYLITGLHAFVDGKQTTVELTVDGAMWSMPVYSDQDLANRVAHALNHAIEVCGGKGKPEVF